MYEKENKQNIEMLCSVDFVSFGYFISLGQFTACANDEPSLFYNQIDFKIPNNRHKSWNILSLWKKKRLDHKRLFVWLQLWNVSIHFDLLLTNKFQTINALFEQTQFIVFPDHILRNHSFWLIKINFCVCMSIFMCLLNN